MEWLDSLTLLVRKFPARRILFGSHAPFFVTDASIAKFTAAKLSVANRAAIGHGNAERFFDL